MFGLVFEKMNFGMLAVFLGEVGVWAMLRFRECFQMAAERSGSGGSTSSSDSSSTEGSQDAEAEKKKQEGQQ